MQEFKLARLLLLRGRDVGNLGIAERFNAYAGSGAVGIEAASRGARPVVCIESALPALAALGANLAALAVLVSVLAHRLRRQRVHAQGDSEFTFYVPADCPEIAPASRG